MKPPTCSTCGAPNDELGRALPPKDPDGFRHPVLTVDAIAVRTGAQGPEVLLIQRGQPPHEGRMAFPGGFVDYGEDPKMAVLRELEEECGITGGDPRVLAVLGALPPHLRKHVVTVAYRVDVGPEEPMAGDDAAEARFVPLDEARQWPSDRWAFDHRSLLEHIL